MDQKLSKKKWLLESVGITVENPLALNTQRSWPVGPSIPDSGVQIRKIKNTALYCSFMVSWLLTLALHVLLIGICIATVPF